MVDLRAVQTPWFCQWSLVAAIDYMAVGITLQFTMLTLLIFPAMLIMLTVLVNLNLPAVLTMQTMLAILTVLTGLAMLSMLPVLTMLNMLSVQVMLTMLGCRFQSSADTLVLQNGKFQFVSMLAKFRAV